MKKQSRRVIHRAIVRACDSSKHLDFMGVRVSDHRSIAVLKSAKSR